MRKISVIIQEMLNNGRYEIINDLEITEEMLANLDVVDIKGYIPQEEALQMLNISKRTLFRAIKDGRLKTIKRRHQGEGQTKHHVSVLSIQKFLGHKLSDKVEEKASIMF